MRLRKVGWLAKRAFELGGEPERKMRGNNACEENSREMGQKHSPGFYTLLSSSHILGLQQTSWSLLSLSLMPPTEKYMPSIACISGL